jgi:hypothetical protein
MIRGREVNRRRVTFRYAMSKMRAVLQKSCKATDGKLSLGCGEAYFIVVVMAEPQDLVRRERELLLYMDVRKPKNR